MKKRIIVSSFLIVLIIGVTFGIFSLRKKEMKEFVVFNDSLEWNKEFYYKVEVYLKAEKLDQIIGYTSEGDQVYSIEGLDSKDWICLRNAGSEYVYRSSKIKPITDISLMDYSKYVVRDYNNIEVILEIKEQEAIQDLKDQLLEENIVTGEIVATDIKNFQIFLKDYPSLEYECSYIIDQHEEHYFYDNYADCTWKLTTHVFENQ